jgi:hypothetical protein
MVYNERHLYANGWAAFSVFRDKKGLFELFVSWLTLASERNGGCDMMDAMDMHYCTAAFSEQGCYLPYTPMLAVCLDICSTREKIDVIFETLKLCEALRDNTLVARTRGLGDQTGQTETTPWTFPFISQRVAGCVRHAFILGVSLFLRLSPGIQAYDNDDVRAREPGEGIYFTVVVT